MDQDDQIYSGNYIPDFYSGENMQSHTFDSNQFMGPRDDIQLDSTIRPLHLRMMGVSRESIISNNGNLNVPKPTHEKFKASNFPIMFIKIGSWEKYSRYEGDVVAKYYYAKKKIVWEFLDGALKNKIEIAFSDIEAIKAITNENQPGTLEILLSNRPLFFRETNPLPKKHTIWHDSSDFTGGQALIFRKHYVQFPPGALDRHYTKLMQSDSRLLDISQRPFPMLDFPYFQSNNSNSSNMSFGHGILPQSRSYPSTQMFPRHYVEANYNLHMMPQNSIHMHDTQTQNLGMHYQQRNDIMPNNIFGQTMSPYYQNTYGAPNLLPMNEHMQFIPNILQEENVQLSGALDERDEILRNIEQHLLGDSSFIGSYDEPLLNNQMSYNPTSFVDNTFNGYNPDSFVDNNFNGYEAS